MYKKMLVLALILTFALTATPAWADEPSGTISVDVKSVSAILGGAWGQGVLTFQGRTYAFKLRGLKLLSVGVKKVSLNGDVYKLNAANDLTGKYKKADPAGITFIVGEKGLVVSNDKGVVLNIKGTKKGLELDLVEGGLTIEQIK
jgi:hypothetical protein